MQRREFIGTAAALVLFGQLPKEKPVRVLISFPKLGRPLSLYGGVEPVFQTKYIRRSMDSQLR